MQPMIIAFKKSSVSAQRVNSWEHVIITVKIPFFPLWRAQTDQQEATHSSRMRMTSALFSKTSCRVMMLGWWISFRMFTSRSMSSLVTPRRLDLLRLFLMNLAANSTHVPLCRHLLTTANWPLGGGGEGGDDEGGGGREGRGSGGKGGEEEEEVMESRRRSTDIQR